MLGVIDVLGYVMRYVVQLFSMPITAFWEWIFELCGMPITAFWEWIFGLF